MTVDISDATVYDIETFPNAFTLSAEMLHTPDRATWEISQFRDDRESLVSWFRYLEANQIPMVGFNNIHFDYVVCHYLYCNPQATYADLYAKAMSIIQGDRFANTIWESDRFTPQIDLFKIHHFDNKAKTQSLKGLQINMRTPHVVDMPLPLNINLTEQQIREVLIPYNVHDVEETKRFAHISMKAIEFRAGLSETLGNDVMNFNDSKIGSKILENRLGEGVCFTRDYNNRKAPRQTIRSSIALNEIIFPYVRFNNSEFNRVLAWMKEQVLTPADIDDPEGIVQTKGVFKELSANAGGIEFHFGTGGVHGSVSGKRIIADENWLIRDIDVAGLYPSIAIVNRLAPAHLGEIFVKEYKGILDERAKYAKGTVENASLKLAGNGTYGNSNNIYHWAYDPQFTMSITINGQLMLCMLAECLLTVPTLEIIQINTDGITYRIHKTMEWMAKQICKQWEAYTLLKLEDADYTRMFIRDVNNYIAEDKKGKLKLKGAYWTPRAENYENDISENSPPQWHKDLGNLVSKRAAVAAMVNGTDPSAFVRGHGNAFDFMCRAKVDRASRLMLGGRELQRTSRYYVAMQGEALIKISPPPEGCKVGDYKRASKIPDDIYYRVLRELPPGTWDARIHTKNKSKYDDRSMAFEAGYHVQECNDMHAFRFDNLNYDFYVNEARKLII